MATGLCLLDFHVNKGGGFLSWLSRSRKIHWQNVPSAIYFQISSRASHVWRRLMASICQASHPHRGAWGPWWCCTLFQATGLHVHAHPMPRIHCSWLVLVTLMWEENEEIDNAEWSQVGNYTCKMSSVWYFFSRESLFTWLTWNSNPTPPMHIGIVFFILICQFWNIKSDLECFSINIFVLLFRVFHLPSWLYKVDRRWKFSLHLTSINCLQHMSPYMLGLWKKTC